MTLTISKRLLYLVLILVTLATALGTGFFFGKQQNASEASQSTPTSTVIETPTPLSLDYSCKEKLTEVAKGAKLDQDATDCLVLRKWHRDYDLQYKWDPTFGDEVLEVYKQVGDRSDGTFPDDSIFLVIVNDPSKSVVVDFNVDIQTVSLEGNKKATLIIGRSFGLYSDPNFVAPSPIPASTDVAPDYNYESPSCTNTVVQSYNPEYDSFSCEFYRYFDQGKYANTYSKRVECENPMIEKTECLP